MVHTKIIDVTVDMWNTMSSNILSSKKHFEKFIQNYLIANDFTTNTNYDKLQIQFPSILTTENRHKIHRYSNYSNMYTESIYVNDDRILNVILSKKYVNDIMNANYDNIKFISTVNVNDTTNTTNTTNMQNIVIQLPVEIPEVTLNEAAPVPVEEPLPEHVSVITDIKNTHEDIIRLLNNNYINLYKIYSINETISSLELLIKSYHTELEVLKSADQLYRNELLTTLIKKLN